MSGTADLYRRWARVAARGSSPIYEQLALAVAEDGAVLRLLESVEFGKRQPNLLFSVPCVGTEFPSRIRSDAWHGRALTPIAFWRCCGPAALKPTRLPGAPRFFPHSRSCLSPLLSSRWGLALDCACSTTTGATTTPGRRSTSGSGRPVARSPCPAR